MNSPFPLLSELPRPQTVETVSERSIDVDVEAARERGFKKGRDEGKALGHGEGYEIGFELGQQEGYQKGFAEGKESGYQTTLAEFRSEFTNVLSALTVAAEAFVERDEVAFVDIQEQTVELAISLAEAILQRELKTSENPGREAIERALSLKPDRGHMVVRLHPRDLTNLGDAGDLAPGNTVELVSDDGVERGGAIVHIGDTTIDSQLSPALARVRKALLHSGEALLRSDEGAPAQAHITSSERVS